MENGLTGFWMRVGSNLNARVVNGTMYKLLNAKKGNTLTHILSPAMRREMFVQLLFRNGKLTKQEKRHAHSAPLLGLTGFKCKLFVPGWESNTKSLRSIMQRRHQDMLRSISLNPPFFWLTGLKDGSASDTLKVFQNRRSGKGKQ